MAWSVHWVLERKGLLFSVDRVDERYWRAGVCRVGGSRSLGFSFLLCPHCGGELQTDAPPAGCARCAHQLTIRNGVLDLRGGEHSLAADDVPSNDNETSSRHPVPKQTSSLAAALPAPSFRHAHLFEGAEFAWKLFLDIRPGMRVLDLGCGYGARALSLARHGVEVLAVETDPAAARFAAARLREALGERAPLVVLASAMAAVPIRHRSIDVVVFPVDLRAASPVANRHTAVPCDGLSAVAQTRPRAALRQLVSDVAGIMTDNGQLVLVAENRWSFDRLVTKLRRAMRGVQHLTAQSLSANKWRSGSDRVDESEPMCGFLGYRRLLAQIGVEVTTTLVQRRNHVHQLHELRERFEPARRMPGGVITARMRRMLGLMPEYAFVARRRGDRAPHLLHRVLAHLGRELDATETVGARRLLISRKDKLVVTTRMGSHRVVVRLTLSDAAHAAEQRSVAMLRQLEQWCPGASWYPHLLASGEVDGQWYAAEQQLNGYALRDLLRTRGDVSDLHFARQLLQAMNPNPDALPRPTLEGEHYHRLVSSPLERVRGVLDDAGLGQPIADVLSSTLHGVHIALGVSHGDFGFSNVFVDEAQAPMLIDWEDATTQGVPVVDCLSFLLSRMVTYRRVNTYAQALCCLATHQLKDEEEEFLASTYQRYQIPMAWHGALVCLCWVQTVSRLTAFSFLHNDESKRFYLHDVAQSLLASFNNDRQQSSRH